MSLKLLDIRASIDQKRMMRSVFLVNPISGRGHLDAYARLYTRAMLEMGHCVVLVARTDGGVPNYIARTNPALVSQLSHVSLDEAQAAMLQPFEDVPADPLRCSLPSHRRAILVMREEGWAGIARRAVIVPKRILLRTLPPTAINWIRQQRRGLLLKLHHRLNADVGRVSFIPIIRAVEGAAGTADRRPDLIFKLYLDMMSESPRSIAALNGAESVPWAGILFHPRRAKRKTAREEAYFASRNARGALFLVPDAIPVYAEARPTLHFALAPDVADLELAERPHALAEAMRARAAGRTVILQIGTIAPHKGIMALLGVIARADPKRFFFAMIGEVHWESFGTDEPRLRAFYAAPPENVLVHEGYVDDERDYNTVIAACDVIYAVYEGFNSSSNSLTKAAGFKRRILVADGTLMGRRVSEARLGATAPAGDPDGILAALSELADKPLDEFEFAGYAQAHSLEALKAVLAEALPHWCSTSQNQADTREV